MSAIKLAKDFKVSVEDLQQVKITGLEDEIKKLKEEVDAVKDATILVARDSFKKKVEEEARKTCVMFRDKVNQMGSSIEFLKQEVVNITIIKNEGEKEIKKLKDQINSLLTDEQKDIIVGEGLMNPENVIYCVEDWVKRIQGFLKERDELKEENEDLNNDDWVIDNHKALKYKVVLDEDFYLQHLGEDLSLIHPDELEKLKEDFEDEKDGRDHDVQQYQETINEKMALETEIEDLKDENKKLKIFQDTFTPPKIDEINKMAEENKKLKEENKKLRSSAKRRQQWFQCLMDCRDNPDNPNQFEIDEYCDSYNMSKKVRKELYEDLL
jgi:cell division protein FtsB